MENIGAVADTGPLVALAKADRLDLLRHMFGTVLVPPSVAHELFAKRSAETRRLEQALGECLSIADHPSIAPEVQAVILNLDRGEAEAIALAYNYRLPLIVDEALGRRSAARLQLQFAGSVGLILEAKRQGHIPAVLPILLEMRRNGYWLADDLVKRAAILAGEPE